MINILFALFLINVNFTLYAMEPKALTKKASFKKKDNSTTKKDTHAAMKKSSSFPSSEKPTEINVFARKHPFIMAMQKKDHNTIKFYLSNPHFNPNPYNAPQTLASLHDYDGINILFNDHRVDFSQRDFEHKLASDYIDRLDPNLHELRCKVFARITLDIVTNKKCKEIKNIYDDNYLTEEYFTDIRERIKKEIEDTKQGDSGLPVKAKFPDYADQKFMTNKMWFILAIGQK